MARRTSTWAVSAGTVAVTTAISAGTNLLTPLVPADWVRHWAIPLVTGVVVLGAALTILTRSTTSAPSAPLAGSGTEIRVRKVAGASSGDGILRLYAVTTDMGLVSSAYQEPGQWSAWRDLKPYAEAVDVAAVATGADTVEVFCADVSGQLWTAVESAGDPLHWVRLPGNAGVGRVVALAALTGWPGHREVFVVGDHGAVAHAWRWNDGSWSDWSSAGVPVPCRDVALSVPAPGILECFALGSDGRIRHRQFRAADERWTDWESTAGEGAPGGMVALDVLNGWSGHREMFCVRTDGGISHRDHWEDEDWGSWRDLSARTPMRDLAAGTTSAGRLEIVAADRDGSLWQRSYADQVWWDEQWRRVPLAGAEVPTPRV